MTQMLQDWQWGGCRKEIDYYEKNCRSRRNRCFTGTQVDAENCSWSIQAVLGICQVSSSSILSGSKSISFIRKNGNILRGGESMKIKGFFPAYRKNRRLVKYFFKFKKLV